MLDSGPIIKLEVRDQRSAKAGASKHSSKRSGASEERSQGAGFTCHAVARSAAGEVTDEKNAAGMDDGFITLRIAAATASIVQGLRMWPLKPAFWKRSMSDGKPKPEMAIPFTGHIVRSSPKTSHPSMSGRPMSQSMASKRHSRAVLSASAPLRATVTFLKPFALNSRARQLAESARSSTSKIS
jgi:hypothetical protein